MRRSSVWRAALAAVFVVACSDSGAGSNPSVEPTPTQRATTAPSAGAHPPVTDIPFEFQMAYDPTHEVVVAIASDGTWLFDVATDSWTKTTNERPLVDGWPRLVYAAALERVVAVNFEMAVEAYDVDSNEWSVVVEPGTVQRMSTMLLAVDQAVGTPVVLQYLPVVQVWRLDPGTRRWAELEQSGGPVFDQGQGAPVMVYDEVADGLVVLCYRADLAGVDAVWKLDLETREWTGLTGVHPLPFGYSPLGHEAVFVPSAGRSVFASRGVTGEYDAANDAWVIYADGQEVEGDLMMMAGTPDYVSPVLVYDPVNERVLAYGGYELDEVWAYDAVTHTWSQVTFNAR